MNRIRIARSTSTANQTKQSATQRRSTPTQHTGEPLPQPGRSGQSNLRPVAFVIEPRDEVYARLAGDLIEAGFRVVRAMSATDALKACGKYQPRVVVASLAFAPQKSWQLAPELATLDRDTRVILYGVEIAIHDYAMADFLGIEQLIEYGGDLFRLSARIRRSLGSESAQTFAKHRSVA